MAKRGGVREPIAGHWIIRLCGPLDSTSPIGIERANRQIDLGVDLSVVHLRDGRVGGEQNGGQGGGESHYSATEPSS